MNQNIAKPKLYLVFGVWFFITGFGFWDLLSYSNTPGNAAAEPGVHDRWPVATQLQREKNTPTLVVFAHPRCPCSAATVGELERLIPHIQKKIASRVVFFKPKSGTLKIEQEKLWKQASSIPGVQIAFDTDGTEVERFGAQTSGQVFLYNSNGILVFQGGITPQRGHMGDNRGRAAILAVAKTGVTSISRTPVFGCSLKNPERSLSSDSK